MPNNDRIRQEICEIGHRLWLKDLCAGTDGNISVRIGPNEVLCTPTTISKGFMKPVDLCTVDLDARQLEGARRCSSEVLLHLEVYKARPEINAVVHVHPPFLAAFAVTGCEIPMGLLTEMDVCVGPIPIIDYAPPGTKELAESILDNVHTATTAVLAHHGAISWSKTLEDAYFKMEIAEAYCQMLVAARQIGPTRQIPENYLKQLLEMKRQMGLTDDPRLKQ